MQPLLPLDVSVSQLFLFNSYCWPYTYRGETPGQHRLLKNAAPAAVGQVRSETAQAAVGQTRP
jgi:hypothetical protein